MNAESIARGRAEWMSGRQEWAAGRVTAGLVRGWQRAVQDAADGDPILDRVTVDDLHLPAVPAVESRPRLAPDSDRPTPVRQTEAEQITHDDIDAEFHRMLAGRDTQQRQDPLW